MFARPIKRLLDGEYALVFRRRLYERDDRIVRVIGMMQQNVVPPQFFEQVVRLRGQAQFSWRKRAKFQVRHGWPDRTR